VISHRHSETHAGVPSVDAPPTPAPGLAALITAVRVAVGKRADWAGTAQLVASALDRHLPSPSILTADQRTGDPDTYKSGVLYSEPDGSFSIVALVWRPRQVTPIHDHVTWCVFAVIQGTETPTSLCNLTASERDPRLRLPRSRGQPGPHPGAALSHPAIAAMTCTDGTVKPPAHGDRGAKRWRHNEHGHRGASQWLRRNL
jgi:hypothetical protein